MVNSNEETLLNSLANMKNNDILTRSYVLITNPHNKRAGSLSVATIVWGGV